MEQWEYTDNGARLEDISLSAYGKYAYLPGYGLTLSKSGLADVFIRYLRESGAENKLILNTPVAHIYWGLQVCLDGPFVIDQFYVCILKKSRLN